MFEKAKSSSFTVLKPNEMSLLNKEARDLYVALKEYIDKSNMIELVKYKRERFLKA
jgi:hypothetical protein